jgi:tRNA nucleotidyltransferase/poly(A) polymerase
VTPRVREALAELLADPVVRALRGALRAEGARAWIVGGAVRDLVLRREVTELDLAVDGDAGEIAARLEALGFGRAFLLSGEKRPRVYRVGGGGRILDLAEIEGDSIGADLARRDFTANAVAVDLASGALLDPHGGLAALAANRLSLVKEKNLQDDPLRALRAARLLATHGLAPDRETSRASRRAAPALARVARERVQAELDKLFAAPRAVPALSWAGGVGLLGPALGLPLSAGRARSAARSLAPLDTPASRRLPPSRRRRLRLALLARTAGIGSEAAARWLRRLRWPGEDAAAVGRLLALADRANERPDGDDAWRWLLDAGDDASDALLLLVASEPRLRPDARRLAAIARRRRRVPVVRGADVLEWLGIPPGPEVGKLLEAVRVEALAGRVRTVEEAREWLRRWNAEKRAPDLGRPRSRRPFRL